LKTKTIPFERILIYKIEDVELLKEIGTYNGVLKFVEELENTYSRFLNGDYSQIKSRLNIRATPT